MIVLEQIQNQLRQLPLEKQNEVLDFISFLQHQLAAASQRKPRSLRQHPGLGSWRGRGVDALDYRARCASGTSAYDGGF